MLIIPREFQTESRDRPVLQLVIKTHVWLLAIKTRRSSCCDSAQAFPGSSGVQPCVIRAHRASKRNL